MLCVPLCLFGQIANNNTKLTAVFTIHKLYILHDNYNLLRNIYIKKVATCFDYLIQPLPRISGYLRLQHHKARPILNTILFHYHKIAII